MQYIKFMTLVASLFFYSVSVWGNSSTCELVLSQSKKTPTEIADSELTNPPKEVLYYIDRVDEIAKGKNTTPRFIDPEEERALQKQWRGTTNAPLAIRDTLRPEMSLLDFQLLAADIGVVKSGTAGDFVSFRWNEEWNGIDMSTNMGMNSSSLIEGSLNSSKHLVPETARGVFVFMHGGGTKTTGHHVAAAISNYLAHYGIVVVSIDAPYHAYGPRPEDMGPRDYYKYLSDLRAKIAPEGMPVFIGGHSMGGLHADNMMRLSDDPELNLKDAFDGYIALSSPLDSAPGESAEEKERVSNAISENEELMARVPEDERDLTTTLLLQGKSSPLGGMNAEMFTSFQNWSQPEHNGAGWSPTLHVMGEYDGLYVGLESVFEDYVANLDNTEVVLMGERTDHNGNEVNIGHMIFDHKKPKDENDPEAEKTPETFAAVKDFMEKVLGEELTRMQPTLSTSKTGLVVDIIREYYNNLAFRVFAKEYKHFVKVGTPKIAELGKASKEIGAEIKSLKNEISRLSKAGEDTAELDEKLSDYESQMAEMRSFQQLTHVPAVTEESTDAERKLHDFAKANVKKRQELDKENEAIFKRKNELSKKVMQAQTQKAKLEKGVSQVVTKALYSNDWERESGAEEIVAAVEVMNGTIDEMVALLTEINEVNSALVRQESDGQTYRMNPDEELIAKYKELDEIYAKYTKQEEEAKSLVEPWLLEAASTEEDVKKALVTLYGSEEAALSGTPNEEGLMVQEKRLREEFKALSEQSSDLEYRRDLLLIEYVDKVASEYYSARFTTVEEELSQHVSGLADNTTHLQKLWNIWIKKIWNSRPAESSTSLY